MLVHLLSLVLLACALSLDGFGVGVTYGLRKIRIPILSIVIISACSGIIIYTSMLIGVWIANYVSPEISKWVGALILMGIGGWALIQLIGSKNRDDDEEQQVHHESEDREAVQDVAVKKTVFTFEIRAFGLVIQILRTPSAADVDRSGVISASEAALLGVALSLDAFGAGLGAALLGFSPLWTCISITFASGSFLYLGTRVGLMFAGLQWLRKLSFIPGVVLIIMGIIRFF